MRGQYVFATLNVAFVLGHLTAKHDSKSEEKALWSPIPGDECNMLTDQYLMVNSENQNTFLQCSPAKRGIIGVWRAMPCPPGQTFQFGKQRCDFDLSSIQVTARSSSQNIKQKYKRAAGDPKPPTIVPAHISYVNQPCNGSYCFGGSVCDDETELCKCPHGTIASNGSLYCQAIVDQMTLDEHDPFEDQTKITKALPGNSCRNGENCTGGSSCDLTTGVCICDDGMVDHDGICSALPTKQKIEINDRKAETSAVQGAADLGEQCDGHIVSCSNGAQCVNGRCACVAPLVHIQNKCVLMDTWSTIKAYPGDFCDSGQHCQERSVCSSVTLRCACPMGTKQSGSRCVDAPPHKELLAAIGDYCDINTDCINGAYCHSGPGRPRCECLSTHVEIDRGCLKVVYPGQQGCSNDKQCAAAYQGATCRNSVCTCPPGSMAIAQTCSEGTGVIGTVPFVEVIPKYPPVLTGSPPGGLCSELVNCLGGALCNSGVCICPERQMQVVDGRCLVVQPVSSNAIVEVHHKLGNQKTFVSAGSACGNAVICVGGAVCVDGICQCGKGLRQVQNRCIREPVAKVQPIPGPKVILPQPLTQPTEAPYCLNDDMCNGHSICINSRCSCPAGTTLSNDRCAPADLNVFKTSTRPLAARDIACIRDQDCSEGTMCVQGVCQCPPAFRRLVDGSCRRTIIDSLCTMDRSCGGQAICINGRCQCPSGSVQHGDVCILLYSANRKKLSPSWRSVLSPMCPNEISPVVDPVNNDYVRCNARAPCPIGSYCHASQGALHPASFYCCPVNRRFGKWTRVAQTM